MANRSEAKNPGGFAKAVGTLKNQYFSGFASRDGGQNAQQIWVAQAGLPKSSLESRHIRGSTASRLKHQIPVIGTETLAIGV